MELCCGKIEGAHDRCQQMVRWPERQHHAVFGSATLAWLRLGSGRCTHRRPRMPFEAPRHQWHNIWNHGVRAANCTRAAWFRSCPRLLVTAAVRAKSLYICTGELLLLHRLQSYIVLNSARLHDCLHKGNQNGIGQDRIN